MAAYAQATYDMSSLKGTSPEIRFQATTDNSLISTLRIDDVVLNVCTNTASTIADYSDLPASYGAAWHTGTGALKLGATWDADTTFAADTDNSTDDGVTFVGTFQAGATATVRVNVVGTPAAGRWLAAWFDWNNDNTFDAAEKVYDGAAVGGNNDLVINVPATVTTAVKYRVRLYDSAATPAAVPLGGTTGGEVEDGLAPCVAAAAITGMTISGNPSNNQIQLAWTAPAGAARYQVWRAPNEPYFTPGANCSSLAPYFCEETPATDYLDTVTDNNPIYVVRAVSACGGYSGAAYQRVGRFRFSLTPGQ